MDFYATSGLLVGAILTLMVLSYLYKATVAWRIVENLVVGLGAGYFTVWGIKNVNDIALTGLQRGEYIYLVPIVLGCLFYTRLSKKYGWLSRWAIALIVGVSTALFLRGAIDVQLLGQVLTLAKPITSTNPLEVINNLLTVILTVCTVTYFIYTREQTGRFLKTTSKIGRYAMMLSFGAIFGGAIVTRMAIMIGVIQFFLFDVLHLR